MEQWEKHFQGMVDTDLKRFDAFIRVLFPYLQGLEPSSIKGIFSGIAKQLRLKHPSAYWDFTEWMGYYHGELMKRHEKDNHQGDVIQFPGKGA